MLEYERRLWSTGCRRLAGVDEAGRGPLAGPVVAAAVVFERDFLEAQSQESLVGLTDSKKLTVRQRETFFARLTESPAVDIGIGSVDAATIDRINILRACHMAMQRALAGLPSPPDHVLVDGNPVDSIAGPCTAVVRGDALSFSIAAASVIAKVTRDRELVALDEAYPAYGFAQHKGYGTKAHMKQLMAHGPCPEHRRSFRPVREAERIVEYMRRGRDRPS